METRYQGRQKNRELCPCLNYTTVTRMNWLKGILIFFLIVYSCFAVLVFVAALSLSLAVASWGSSLAGVCRLLTAAASLVVEHGL